MHGDALDTAVDAAASALTATPPPSSLRGTVRARIATASSARSAWHMWVPALVPAALILVAVWLWPQGPGVELAPGGTVASTASGPVAPAASASVANVAAPRAPATLPAAEGHTASAPPPAGRRGVARIAQDAVRLDAAARAAAAESVPPLEVEELNVVALQPATLAFDAVPLPMPLTIDRVDIEPLALR
jgi:hypothetical protein